MNARFRLISLLVVASVLLAACAPAAQPAPAKAPVAAATVAPAKQEPATQAKDWPLSRGKKICHVINVGDPYSTAKVNLGAKEASLFGLQYDVYDMQADIPTEIRKIEECIAKKYDVIILVAYDPLALNAAIRKAKEAGIPVIAEGGFPEGDGAKDVASLIGSDGVFEGKAAGDLICKTLKPGDGWVMLEGGTGHPLVPMRGGEAVKWNKENCPGVTFLAGETGKWNREYSRTVMENYITTYKDKVKLVYCHNDDMCMGAAKAVEEAGLKGKIKVLGVDGGNKEVYDAIRSGLFFGTILNDCSFIATTMIHAARDLMESRPILSQYISPSTQITKDNVDKFNAWW